MGSVPRTDDRGEPAMTKDQAALAVVAAFAIWVIVAVTAL